MTECPCVCHGHGATFRPPCDVVGGCGHLHTDERPTIAKRRAEHPVDVAGVLTELAFLREHWEHLANARIPGTSRPWRQELLDPRRLEQYAALDAIERANRDPDAPGFTRASMPVPILDLMVEIWLTLDDLVIRIEPWLARSTPVDHSGPTRDLRGLFDLTTEWLPRVVDLVPELLDRADRALPKLSRETATALSLIRSGQLLAGAVCPWCRGVTPGTPSGGKQTMRVEEIIKARPARNGLAAIEPLVGVVCWNPQCEPPEEDVGIRHKGRPAWPEHEWDWLAKRLMTAEPIARRSMTTETPTGDAALPIVHSGRSGIDQAIAIVGRHGGTLAGVTFEDGND